MSEHPDVLDLNQVRSLVQTDAVDAIVNAGGPRDNRSRLESLSEWTQQLLDAYRGIPAILISTTRVFEGFEDRPNENASGRPLTPYGRANTEYEQLCLEARDGWVLGLAEVFYSPMVINSPQTELLSWSLILEGWQTGHICVRSWGGTSREFVNAMDLARTVEILVAPPSYLEDDYCRPRCCRHAE